MNHDGVSAVVVSSPIFGQDTFFVFGYGSESATPFSDILAKYDKNQDGQLSPEEYRGNALLVSIGKYLGNRDLIVTKEKWDERYRSIVGNANLVAIRLERDSKAAPGSAVHPSELWRYDKSFVGVIPSPLYEGVLYTVKNGGILMSFDAETGAVA